MEVRRARVSRAIISVFLPRLAAPGNSGGLFRSTTGRAMFGRLETGIVMQKWEYLAVRFTEKDHTNNALNHRGDRGWELVSVVKNVDELLCFFKRPVKS